MIVAFIYFLIYAIVVAGVAYLVVWGIGQLGLGDPPFRIIRAVIYVVAGLIILLLLLDMVGGVRLGVPYGVVR